VEQPPKSKMNPRANVSIRPGVLKPIVEEFEMYEIAIGLIGFVVMCDFWFTNFYSTLT